MAKALFVPCYPGELGWEIINYVPYVNHIHSKGDFSEVHIVVRRGREALYTMGDHFYPIDLSTGKSMGNSGHTPPKSDVIKKLKKRGFEVTKIDPLPAGCRFAKRRKFILYKANEDSLNKWKHIPDNAVVLCVRGRSFGKHKNWKGDKWKSLCAHFLSNSFVPVITGAYETVSFEVPEGCIDIRNKTTVDDFIAVIQRSRFVVGQSTGPVHLASMSGVPHAVWGSSRIEERYLKSWNPHNTPVSYLSLGSHFDGEVKDVIRIVEDLLKKI